MNIDGLDDDDDDDGVATQFVHSEHLAALERRIYGHVLAAVDLDALSNLEQITISLVMEALDSEGERKRKRAAKTDALPAIPPHAELAIDLAAQLIEGALRRLVDDPRRYMDCGPPHGVTPEEAAAVAFDEDCPYCVAIRADEQAQREHLAKHPTDEEEACPCCDMLVESWREEHKEKLAKAGLADVKHKPVSSFKRGSRIEVS
jgi:hypothetical protein